MKPVITNVKESFFTEFECDEMIAKINNGLQNINKLDPVFKQAILKRVVQRMHECEGKESRK